MRARGYRRTRCAPALRLRRGAAFTGDRSRAKITPPVPPGMSPRMRSPARPAAGRVSRLRDIGRSLGLIANLELDGRREAAVADFPPNVRVCEPDAADNLALGDQRRVFRERAGSPVFAADRRPD